MLKYEKIVAEDLNLGSGTVSVTNPAGGTMTGTKINAASIPYYVGGDTSSEISIADALEGKIVAGKIFFPDGNTVDFDLDTIPASLFSIDVVINGFSMIPGVDFTWDNALRVTTTVAPSLGDTMFIRYLS